MHEHPRVGTIAFLAILAQVLKIRSSSIPIAQLSPSSSSVYSPKLEGSFSISPPWLQGQWDGTRWDRMGWDKMGWDEMGWNGMGTPPALLEVELVRDSQVMLFPLAYNEVLDLTLDLIIILCVYL